MDKKNIILAIIILLISHNIYAQKVGINTNLPEANLHVNGSIQIRKDLKLGGTVGNSGSSGLPGELVTSRGSGKSPVWALPGVDIKLGFRITQSTTLSDSIGVVYRITDSCSVLKPAFTEDSPITSDWTLLNGLETEITPTEANNRLVLSLQALVQSLATEAAPADSEVQIGIFVDGKLRSTRPISIMGVGVPFVAGTLFDSFANLPIKANKEPYKIQVGVALRYHNLEKTNSTISPEVWEKLYILTVGRSGATSADGSKKFDPGNTNNLMNMTSFTVDLYEEIN